MSTYTVAEAGSRLPELVDRALAGEGIVITLDGRPGVQFKPLAPSAAPLTPLDLDWLAAHRVGSSWVSEDAGALLERLRDEA